MMAEEVGESSEIKNKIGKKKNELIMGPGGYKFGDYWRMGLPLEIVIVIAALPLLLMAWPL